jgi:hypothetical protein
MDIINSESFCVGKKYTIGWYGSNYVTKQYTIENITKNYIIASHFERDKKISTKIYYTDITYYWGT